MKTLLVLLVMAVTAYAQLPLYDYTPELPPVTGGIGGYENIPDAIGVDPHMVLHGSVGAGQIAGVIAENTYNEGGQIRSNPDRPAQKKTLYSMLGIESPVKNNEQDNDVKSAGYLSQSDDDIPGDESESSLITRSLKTVKNVLKNQATSSQKIMKYQPVINKPVQGSTKLSSWSNTNQHVQTTPIQALKRFPSLSHDTAKSRSVKAVVRLPSWRHVMMVKSKPARLPLWNRSKTFIKQANQRNFKNTSFQNTIRNYVNTKAIEKTNKKSPWIYKTQYARKYLGNSKVIPFRNKLVTNNIVGDKELKASMFTLSTKKYPYTWTPRADITKDEERNKYANEQAEEIHELKAYPATSGKYYHSIKPVSAKHVPATPVHLIPQVHRYVTAGTRTANPRQLYYSYHGNKNTRVKSTMESKENKSGDLANVLKNISNVLRNITQTQPLPSEISGDTRKAIQSISRGNSEQLAGVSSQSVLNDFVHGDGVSSANVQSKVQTTSQQQPQTNTQTASASTHMESTTQTQSQAAQAQGQTQSAQAAAQTEEIVIPPFKPSQTSQSAVSVATSSSNTQASPPPPPPPPPPATQSQSAQAQAVSQQDKQSGQVQVAQGDKTQGSSVKQNHFEFKGVIKNQPEDLKTSLDKQQGVNSKDPELIKDVTDAIHYLESPLNTTTSKVEQPKDEKNNQNEPLQSKSNKTTKDEKINNTKDEEKGQSLALDNQEIDVPKAESNTFMNKLISLHDSPLNSRFSGGRLGENLMSGYVGVQQSPSGDHFAFKVSHSKSSKEAVDAIRDDDEDPPIEEEDDEEPSNSHETGQNAPQTMDSSQMKMDDYDNEQNLQGQEPHEQEGTQNEMDSETDDKLNSYHDLGNGMDSENEEKMGLDDMNSRNDMKMNSFHSPSQLNFNEGGSKDIESSLESTVNQLQSFGNFDPDSISEMAQSVSEFADNLDSLGVTRNLNKDTEKINKTPYMSSQEFEDECLELKLTFEEHQGDVIYDDSNLGNYARLVKGADVAFDDMQGGFAVHLKPNSEILLSNHFKGKPMKSATIALWVNLDEVKGHHNLFKTVDKEGVLHYNLAVNDGKVTWSHRDDNGNQLFAITTHDNFLNSKQWQQVTGTVDAVTKEALLFIDGKLVGHQGKVSGIMSRDWSVAAFGGDSTGAMDNIYIYKCALGPEKILQLYSGSSNTVEQQEYVKAGFL